MRPRYVGLAAAAFLVMVSTYYTHTSAAPTRSRETMEVQEEAFSSPAQIDRAAAASFVIMSDHKGYGPQDSEHMERMIRWTNQMGAAFTIGMGDHLKRGWNNLILRYMDEHPQWRDQFYPNIADGENEFYGAGQGDWGAGRRLLTDMGFASRPNVTVRPNGAEYYARLPLADYTVHLIQLHYSDQPKEDSIAFNELTRAWLDSMLTVIPNSPKDIVIVGAHSRLGRWVNMLREDRRQRVLTRADLVMSATTHRFVHFDYGPDSAFVCNTGSTDFGARDSSGVRQNGFLTVHLLRNPDRLLVQYLDLNSEQRTLVANGHTYARMLSSRRTLPVTFAAN